MEPEFVGPTPTEFRGDVPPFATHLAAPTSYYPREDDHSVASVVSRILLRKVPPSPSYDVFVIYATLLY